MEPTAVDELGREVWSIEYAADVYEVPAALLRRALRSGRLPARRVDGRLRVRPDEVEEFIVADFGPLH